MGGRDGWVAEGARMAGGGEAAEGRLLAAAIGTIGVGVLALGVGAWFAGAAMRVPAQATPVARPKVRMAARGKTIAPARAVVKADAVAEGMVIRRVLDVPRPFTHGDYVWDDAGVPAGRVVVTVDLMAQTLSVFRAGYEIGTAVILYGADEKPTPLGIFPVTQKDARHVSSLYGAPMPYMLRLTADGVSIHGSDVRYGYVSHGCIGVPTPFAAKLFGVVKLGDRVIVTRGEMVRLGEAISAA